MKHWKPKLCFEINIEKINIEINNMFIKSMPINFINSEVTIVVLIRVSFPVLCSNYVIFRAVFLSFCPKSIPKSTKRLNAFVLQRNCFVCQRRKFLCYVTIFCIFEVKHMHTKHSFIIIRENALQLLIYFKENNKYTIASKIS